MELRWWFVMAGGLALLAGVALAAYCWPIRQRPRSLRPLAWVQRLTALPEYVRAYRRYRIMLAAIAIATTGLLLAAIVATARPVSSKATAAEINRAHPEDINLCIAYDPAAHDVSELLNYFRDQAKTFDTQRLALTSATLRVIPMTGDNAYVADRLGYFGGLNALVGKDKQGPEDGKALQRGRLEFSRGVAYADYARTVNDALALCMTGFPGFTKAGDRRRSAIFLGPTAEQRQARPIYSDAKLAELARTAQIQLNVLTPTAAEEGGAVRRLAEATGGRFITYLQGGKTTSPGEQAGIDKTFRGHLDEIRANPPVITQSDGTVYVQKVQDHPNLILAIALAIAVVFASALAGVRR
ncbi:hypothetical protein DDK07_12780 [Mycobacteroides abscessus]|nr:hypothetical protein MA4S0206_2234 [Mycobacteroides abscessus 4S-0206]EIV51979.1 hypothetical protein MA4S0116R_0773 [Mycobacteroides abscessus 4S-0116-R]OTR19723.1 hypothetical protein B9M80_03305 [Mycobacteroides abscessus]RWU56811.1 hypothetical protein EPJ93_19180 [Mycobacteroides abscessus subsp. abscessus]PVB47625.1 hypothetical protein DDK07_12780 [Mycobacteroides abscessus]